MVFDPEVISPEQLAEIFWTEHDPATSAFSGQYRSIFFYENEEQKALAERTALETGARLGVPIRTAIEPLENFYPAEQYHQKYYLQSRTELTGELKTLYPDLDTLLSSRTAARLNGYIAGQGTGDQFAEDLKNMELPAPLAETARKMVRK